ncbi:MAG: DUF1573 domain-containing protein [Planctomycetota bacterium]|nr:DUF1573 domain-containing protein [Planctomycetota bacterium]
MNALRVSLLPIPFAAVLLAGCSGEAAPTGEAVETASAPNPVVETDRVFGQPTRLVTGRDMSKFVAAAASKQDARPTDQPTFPTLPNNPRVESPSQAYVGPPGGIQLAEGASSSKDYGEMIQGAEGTHTFRMKSNGEGPLIVSRIKPSCGCTAAEIQLVGEGGERLTYRLGDPIPVGSEFELETVLKTVGRTGQMKTSVALFSNDTKNNPFRLELLAKVEPVLTVEPRMLDFKRITSADVKEGTIRVESKHLGPFKLTLDESQLVEPVQAELRPVYPDSDGRSEAWDLDIRLGPNTPEGIRSYRLRLITDLELPEGYDARVASPLGAETAEIPKYREVTAIVNALVSGLVVATPNFISLGLVRPGQVIERHLTVESLDGDFQLPSAPAMRLLNFQGEESELSGSFTFAATMNDNGTLDLMVRLEGVPETVNGSFGGMIQIDIGHPTKEKLEIRFSGVSRPGVPAQRTGG